MNTIALRPLSERIEKTIQNQAAVDVGEAISRARRAAMKAYGSELEPICGSAFGGVLAMALATFEDSITTQARQAAEQVRLQKLVERLQDEVGGQE